MIVGSSAGALIGLQFVVLTLIAERPVRDMERASSTFSTPTIVHFGAVLLVAAIISVPWRAITGVAVLWGVLGAAGAVYVMVIVRRMRAQTAYSPVFEDHLFHVLLPLAAYATLVGAALAAASRTEDALFAVAAAAVVLLFVGIHAWDAVTYHVFARQARKEQ